MHRHFDEAACCRHGEDNERPYDLDKLPRNEVHWGLFNPHLVILVVLELHLSTEWRRLSGVGRRVCWARHTVGSSSLLHSGPSAFRSFIMDWAMITSPYAFDWRSAPLSEWYWPFCTAIAYLIVVTGMLPSAVKVAENTQAERAAAKTPLASSGAGSDVRASSAPRNDAWSTVISSHNMILCLWSAVMFVGCAYELISRASEAGEGSSGWLFCEPPIDTSSAAAATAGNGTISAARAGTWDADVRFSPAGGIAATGPLFYWSYIYYLSKYYELFDTILALAKVSLLLHRS